MPDTIATVDFDRFRLSRLVDRLIEADEVDIVADPVPLAGVAERLDGNPRAVLFRSVGPEGAALIGNVMGSRARLALALGTGERALLPSMLERLARPIPPIEVTRGTAPVQEVVLEGEDADLTALPVHLQHALDGAPYISAGLDFSRDPATGWTNIGMRRLMLRGRREAGIDLNAPSDLRAIYGAAHGSGEPLPVAIVVGAHPADALASLSLVPPQDELALLGGVRGAAVPVVECVTSDLKVPADAEMVLEGHLDPAGWSEPEGPYGEYVGYYGVLKSNPVFRLSAIARRSDALFQTVTIGGRYMESTDTAQICALKTEISLWKALETALREPVGVYVTASCGGMYNARVSLRQRVPGEARNAIAAVFGSSADVKHVFVADADIDDSQVDWALHGSTSSSRRASGRCRFAAGRAGGREGGVSHPVRQAGIGPSATRFQADRDIVVASLCRGLPGRAICWALIRSNFCMAECPLAGAKPDVVGGVHRNGRSRLWVSI